MLKHLLLLSLLCISTLASARTLYMKAEPRVNPSKTVPNFLKTNDKDGNKIAVITVITELSDLNFTGSGMAADATEIDGTYYVPLKKGADRLLISHPELKALNVYFDGGAKSGAVYVIEVYDDEDDANGYRQHHHTLPVRTELGSTIYLDGLPVEIDTESQLTPIELNLGKHIVTAEKVFNATESGRVTHAQARTFYSAEKEINVTTGSKKNLAEISLPITGSIDFKAHNKHKYETVQVKLEVDPKNPILNNEPSIIPEEEAFKADNTCHNLRGNYLATFSSYGYKTKKSRYTVYPGQRIDGEIKLDPINANYWGEYVFSLSSVIGLELGGCGKYFGWMVRCGLLGINDPTLANEKDDRYYPADKDLSWNLQTGPVFRILRTRTCMYLSLGGGYTQQYYDKYDPNNHLSSWVGSAKLTLQFPKGWRIGVGYNLPFKTYDEILGGRPGLQENLFISIGGTL